MYYMQSGLGHEASFGYRHEPEALVERGEVVPRAKIEESFLREMGVTIKGISVAVPLYEVNFGELVNPAETENLLDHIADQAHEEDAEEGILLTSRIGRRAIALSGLADAELGRSYRSEDGVYIANPGKMDRDDYGRPKRAAHAALAIKLPQTAPVDARHAREALPDNLELVNYHPERMHFVPQGGLFSIEVPQSTTRLNVPPLYDPKGRTQHGAPVAEYTPSNVPFHRVQRSQHLVLAHEEVIVEAARQGKVPPAVLARWVFPYKYGPRGEDGRQPANFSALAVFSQEALETICKLGV